MYIAVRCVVNNATMYDILLGQQTLYPIGFSLDSWTKEAWFRPGWSLGDCHKKSLLVSFCNLVGVTGSEIAMYGCVALEDILATRDSLLEGNMFAFDTLPASYLQAPTRIGGFERHPKDPLTPWGSPRGLTQRCHGLVK